MPVIVNVLVRTGLAVGPVTLVPGGWSVRPKVSVFFRAGVLSPVPVGVERLRPQLSLRLPVMVSGSDQFAVRRPVLCSVVLIVFDVVCHVVRLSAR